jgi:hypothetical protein
MSLKKKDVYSKLSDYSRKILGKSTCRTLEENQTAKPPNFLNYKDIENIEKNNDIIIIKNIEEPYCIQDINKQKEMKDVILVKPERNSFNLCKIM